MLDPNTIQTALAFLIVLAGFISPVAFAITEIVKSFVTETKYLPIISIAIGALVGAAFTFILPALGIQGANLIVFTVAGLIGGYLATKQYDTAAKNTYDKIDENK